MDLTRSGKMSAKNMLIEYISISHVAGVDPCKVGQTRIPVFKIFPEKSKKDPKKTCFERTASARVSVCSHVNHVGARICGGGPAALACSETWTLSSCRIPGLRCLRIFVQQQFLQFHHRLLWVDSAPDEAMSFRRTDSVRIPSWLVVSDMTWQVRAISAHGPGQWSFTMDTQHVEDPKDETTKGFVGCRGQHPSRRQHLSHEGDLKLLDCWANQGCHQDQRRQMQSVWFKAGKGNFHHKKMGLNRFDSLYHSNSVIVRSAKSLQCQTVWYSVSPDL